MSETTDLDEIRALEHRITSALDRIGQGLAARPAQSPPVSAEASDQAEPSDQAEQAERIAALEAALGETQAALAGEQSANSELSEKLKSLEAARQADDDSAAREKAALGEELEAARAALAAAEEKADSAAAAAREQAQAEAEPDPRLAELEAEVERQRDLEAMLRRRIARLRRERNEAREERNTTVEQLEEVQGKVDQLQALVDSSAPEASGELARLRESNRVLRDTVDELKEAFAADGETDSDLFASALSAELESLNADRAAEAAEARAILSEIRPVLQGGQADA